MLKFTTLRDSRVPSQVRIGTAAHHGRRLEDRRQSSRRPPVSWHAMCNTSRSDEKVAEGVQEQVMKRSSARAYLDGFGTVWSVLELDGLTVWEVMEAFDPEWEDSLPNPWKLGYNAAIRAAWGQ